MPNKFGYLQMTAVGFADTDCEYELRSWGGCGEDKGGIFNVFQVVGKRSAGPTI